VTSYKLLVTLNLNLRSAAFVNLYNRSFGPNSFRNSFRNNTRKLGKSRQQREILLLRQEELLMLYFSFVILFITIQLRLSMLFNQLFNPLPHLGLSKILVTLNLNLRSVAFVNLYNRSFRPNSFRNSFRNNTKSLYLMPLSAARMSL
jgi:hypothetical protein